MSLQQSDQSLVGYRTNEEWNDLLTQVAAMIEELDRLEDRDARGKIFAALQAIDAMHREALHRLVRLFKEGVLEQVVTDPAIYSLMAMYDLLPSRSGSARKAWDFLTDEERAGGSRSSPERVSPPVAVEPPQQHPHWRPIPLERPLIDGEAFLSHLEEEPLIVAKVDGSIYAFAALCPVHGAVMSDGTAKGYSWICPHGPGCIYDIRNGARLGGGSGLTCRPLRHEATGGLQVGFGIPFVPKLPTF
jgi:nitrite reductase/ring-hydroxylating ferredoxin subunit